jgi:DNA-binding transcriptional LysR family regulator
LGKYCRQTIQNRLAGTDELRNSGLPNLEVALFQDVAPVHNPALRRATTARSALKGEKLVSMPPSLPMQQLVDEHLAKAGVVYQPNLTVNYLHTQIAMVEAGEGAAIMIRYGGRKPPRVAEQFTSFLQSYIATWAGRSGIR